MQLSKKPIVLYDGVLKQLQANDNIGRYVLTVVSKSVGNDQDELFSFTQVHADTSSGSFELFLPQSPQLGDLIKVLDIKSVFSTNKLIINSNSKKIEGGVANIELDVSGAIIDFLYSGEDDGWILDIGGKNLNIFDDSLQYDIAPSTAFSRRGRLVFQTGVANTVDLVNAGDTSKTPAFGTIVYDGDTFVKVRTKAGSVIECKFDSEASISPGDHLFVSKLETGKVTNDPDPQEVAFYQRIGSANDAPSEGYVKVNFWPNPEIYV